MTVSTTNTTTAQYYLPSLATETDYYAFSSPNFHSIFNGAHEYFVFGSEMRARTSGAQYRFGFNGKMKDNEVEGEGDVYDFGARMYDSRLGRFMSCDPMEKKFAWMSPYAAFADDPINLADEDGNEPIKKQAGTVSDFVTILNNTPSKLGTQVGANAGEVLLRLGQTEFS